ncbi:hypothetical protein DENIS_0205 [Desulfonema ishimotonii]|uniref:Uncharacterized protein n=1 Tax=Desulfonema ishimotonii TaxID=45657 RepID=A0A401FQK3_9BACT|nr:hypothetical protein [Desulfonema ishimotonii]GBC59269.1 hypothetical protein DENIS_0205 [Desulfonema ishimotonii]
MNNNSFQFNLYRLNIVDGEPSLFESLKPILSDENLIEILDESTTSSYDVEKETNTSHYRWSFRKFQIVQDKDVGDVVSLILARSTVEKHGEIVTDQDIEKGFSKSSPPLAATVSIFFFMSRHLIAVERNSTLMISKTWQNMSKKILISAAKKKGYSSSIVFEPVTQHHELIKLFKSFSKLTRVKVNLRLPNPELSRYTRNLYEDLRKSGIREYLQDMKNPRGLSNAEDARPFASVIMAQEGYKEGELTLEGWKDGKFQKEITGEEAARGKISQLKDFVRGVSVDLKSKEAKKIIKAIYEEIERIAPREE